MTKTRKILSRAVLLALVLAALCLGAMAADYSADTPQKFYAALSQSIKNQETGFTITYTGTASLDGGAQPDLASLLHRMSAVSPDTADSYDYQVLNVNEGSLSLYGKKYIFDLRYLATPAQLAQVRTKAAEIVKSLDLSGEDDYTKIKLIYEYVCTHYTYDNTLSKFTAYDGLTTGSMVCQGYALLVEQLMWDAGIPCRAITGVSASQNHAWNIVRLNGQWYYLDATWDASQGKDEAMKWDYFLLGSSDFSGHTTFTAFSTEPFASAHPLANTAYTLSRISVLVNGDSVTSLAVRNGVNVQLVAQYGDGAEAENVTWVSADPGVVSVSADGVLESNTPGSTLISVSVTGRRGVIGAQIPTAAVNLKASSAWAFDDVTSYYLQQLLPISLCSDFQQGITRAEFARMLYQFVSVTRGWGRVVVSMDFTDIKDSDDAYAILLCKSIGLFDGTSAATFSPNAGVTREQAAKVLVNLANYLNGSELSSDGALSYADAADISSWARGYVSTATGQGILQGSASSFHPLSQMTREQLVVALERMYLSYGKQKTAA